MKLVLIGGTKGGPGKSTLCVELSVEAARRGNRVLVVDGNVKQGSTTDWLAHREQLIDAAKAGNGDVMPKRDNNKSKKISAKAIAILSMPTVIKLDNEGFWTELGEKVDLYDWVFLDVPGYDSPEIKSALAIVDIALFPLKLSMLDLRTANKINARIESYLGDEFPLKKAMWILNEVSPPSANRSPPDDEEEIASALRDNFANLSVAEQRIALRKPFRKAANGGYCVVDDLQPGSSWVNGRQEIRGLYDEMAAAIGVDSEKARAA